MKINFSGDRVLAVVAHPDDAELLCAGTLARAKDDGAALGICVLCLGDKGLPSKPVKNLAATRKRELAQSAKLLGASLLTGGFPDGALFDDEKTRLRVTELVRQFRPTLVLAHAPEDYHPDHKAASALAQAASWFCASRGHKTRSRVMPAPPTVWFMDTIAMQGFTPGFYVDITSHMELKEQMLLCHRTQLQRGEDGDFSPLLEMMHMQAGMRGLQSGVKAAEAFRMHDVFMRSRAL